MSSDVLVALLVSVILGHVVQVFTTNNDSSMHLGRDDDTAQDTTTNRNLTSERALLVDVRAENSLLGGLESKADIFVPTLGSLRGLRLRGVKDMGLLLESTLRLDSELSSHGLIFGTGTSTASVRVQDDWERNALKPLYD